MKISEFQQLIEETYKEKDGRRGVDMTFVWFIEEVGELARALHRGDDRSLKEEFADCLAWLSTLASLKGIDLEEAVKKYANGCNRCNSKPCRCSEPSSIGDSAKQV